MFHFNLWRVATHTLNQYLGSPFVQSHRIIGHPSEARTVVHSNSRTPGSCGQLVASYRRPFPDMLLRLSALESGEALARSKSHFPNETPEYRQARNTLLTDEIELRRHIERIAALRPALPPGGTVPEDYTLESEKGPVRFSDLFGDKQTLMIYSWMFGPQRKRPCPV